ncbi:MAG TPA: urease accessory UreF family protein [Verrucomicrobiae bacterium]|nr:urease accessory UreF family protein [Verrucomicrobiae bacterium]
MLLWQVADSAFPTGGFAHSVGLEAAWQHGEVRNRAELLAFLETNLHQLGRAAVPFVNTAYDNPERLAELDALCDAFLSNHVANRASRLQGRAFLTAMERIFLERGGPQPQHSRNEGGLRSSGVPLSGGAAVAGDSRAPFAHFAPVFGACLRELAIPRATTIRLFLFNHLRSGFAAAVRLNIVGPMEAQRLQHRLAPLAEEVAARSATFTLDDLAQTAPLLDLWQGAQDRLYSRLFQS